jgi:hypothetical protein
VISSLLAYFMTIFDLGLNKLNEAADAAALANDGELLSNVRSKAKDQATIDYIDALAVKAGFQPSSGR